MSLKLVPLTLREANAYVERNHRHHGPARGCIVTVGAELDGEVVGVCIVGRPLARMLQDGYTAEVLRLCTDGSRNACSMLYRAAWRAVKALGYRRLVTYTLPQEGDRACALRAFNLSARQAADHGLATDDLVWISTRHRRSCDGN